MLPYKVWRTETNQGQPLSSAIDDSQIWRLTRIQGMPTYQETRFKMHKRP